MPRVGSLLVLAAAFSGSQLVHSEGEWDYGNKGPDTWPLNFATCNGSMQSPVNVDTSELEAKLLPALTFNRHWSSDVQATLANNGHSAEVTVKSWTSPATLSGGPLTSRYVFANMHFHWGANCSEGSEHTLGGQSFSMEAHVVHYKEEYGNVTNAYGYQDGIAVVAFFLQVDATNNTDLAQLQAALPLVANYESSTSIQLREATQWFHNSAMTGGYYTYLGSLTTPPCSEAVIWIIYPNPVTISCDQVAVFRSLKSSSGSLLLTNHRSTQNLNNRTVQLAYPQLLHPATLNHLGEGYVRL